MEIEASRHVIVTDVFRFSIGLYIDHLLHRLDILPHVDKITNLTEFPSAAGGLRKPSERGLAYPISHIETLNFKVSLPS
jgi:hypothetical protein